ncbi:MAG: TIGR03663 family protein [Chthoniobacterales bacterium]|nr:TIGR03663 family protein [Chthoniobacterales bacterium]
MFLFRVITSNIFILLLAAFLRLWDLDLKPPHFDEGINGWFADGIKKQGFYAYDPTNYHGPLFFYILFLAQTIFGRSLWVLRIPAVLASITTVWLALCFDRFLGKTAARWGALTLALSPAMVFYGRYAIHESWVAASLMIVLLGLFGLWHSGKRSSLFLAIFGSTLLILLKETAVIHFSSVILATTFLFFFDRWLFSQSKSYNGSSSSGIIPEPHLSGITIAEPLWHYSDLFFGILLSMVVIFFFYSGGLLHIRGFLNLFTTLPAWIRTGTNTGGHIKSSYQWGPFNYYWIALMVRYEITSLIGFFYAFWLLWQNSKLSPIFHYFLKAQHYFLKINRSHHLHFWSAYYLATYGIGVFFIYSIIPYKTPWCLISILWPFSLLFGVFLQQFRNKKIVLTLGFLFLTLSFFLCVRLNFFNYTNFSEPYVYVQTSPEIKRLTDPLLNMAKEDRCNLHLKGQILLESYFPLPWILGDFTSIGYFSTTHLPKKYDGDFIVVESSRTPAIEKQLKEPYYREEFQMRDAMEECIIYFKKSVFEKYFDKVDRSQQYADPKSHCSQQFQIIDNQHRYHD